MKKFFAIILAVGALCCCFIGCSKASEPKIENFTVTYAEFSNALEDAVWDNGEKSSVFKVKTTDGTMTIPQTSTSVVYIAKGEEIRLEVRTTLSNMGVGKEIVKYILYVPESFIAGYNYQPI